MIRLDMNEGMEIKPGTGFRVYLPVKMPDDVVNPKYNIQAVNTLAVAFSPQPPSVKTFSAKDFLESSNSTVRMYTYSLSGITYLEKEGYFNSKLDVNFETGTYFDEMLSGVEFSLLDENDQPILAGNDPIKMISQDGSFSFRFAKPGNYKIKATVPEGIKISPLRNNAFNQNPAIYGNQLSSETEYLMYQAPDGSYSEIFTFDRVNDSHMAIAAFFEIIKQDVVATVNWERFEDPKPTDPTPTVWFDLYRQPVDAKGNPVGDPELAPEAKRQMLVYKQNKASDEGDNATIIEWAEDGSSLKVIWPQQDKYSDEQVRYKFFVKQVDEQGEDLIPAGYKTSTQELAVINTHLGVQIPVDPVEPEVPVDPVDPVEPEQPINTETSVDIKIPTDSKDPVKQDATKPTDIKIETKTKSVTPKTGENRILTITGIVGFIGMAAVLHLIKKKQKTS